MALLAGKAALFGQLARNHVFTCNAGVVIHSASLFSTFQLDHLLAQHSVDQLFNTRNFELSVGVLRSLDHVHIYGVKLLSGRESSTTLHLLKNGQEDSWRGFVLEGAYACPNFEILHTGSSYLELNGVTRCQNFSSTRSIHYRSPFPRG